MMHINVTCPFCGTVVLMEITIRDDCDCDVCDVSFYNDVGEEVDFCPSCGTSVLNFILDSGLPS